MTRFPDPATDPGADPAEPLAAAFGQLETMSRRFGTTLSQSLAKGIIEGRSLGDVLKGVGDQLLRLSLQQGQKALAGGINDLLGSGISQLGTLLTGGLAGGRDTPSTLGSEGGWGRLPPAGNAAGTTIHMHVQAQDAASFLRAESQVNAALARAVRRGQRSL